MSRFTFFFVFVGLLVAAPASAAPSFRADQHPGTPDQREQGGQVYAQCASCHGAQGEGRPGFAPRLASDDLLSVVGDEFLRRTIIEGRIGTQMPPWDDRLAPAEIDALVAWLRGSQRSDGVVLDRSPLQGSVEAGAQAFAARCAACHGPAGEGMAASFAAPAIGAASFLSQVDDATLRGLVRKGRSGTLMTPFPPEVLDSKQLDGIILWLRANAWQDLPWSSSPSASGAAPSPRDPDETQRERPQLGLLPDFSYDEEYGLSFGVDAWLGGGDALEWSVDLSTYMGLKPQKGRAPIVSFQSHSLGFHLDGLADGRLGFSISGGFDTTRDATWYGLGNGSVIDEGLMEVQPEHYTYGTLSPWVDLSLRGELLRLSRGRLELSGGWTFAYNEIDVHGGSRLAKDLALGRVSLGDGVGMKTVGGLRWDGTDDDVDPTSGVAAEVSARGGLAGRAEQLGAFGGANVSLRGYVPIWDRNLVLAGRVMADVQWGEVPFHRLTQQGGLEDGEATGGGSSIRGVWADRRAGRIKLLSNLELRAKLAQFELPALPGLPGLEGLPVGVGVVGFVDAGRVWADFEPQGLDGEGLDLALGLGVGARLHLGDDFILRVDVGWSPSDGTEGVYLDFGHAF